MAKMTDWSREGKAGGWVWEWGWKKGEWKGKGRKGVVKYGENGSD